MSPRKIIIDTDPGQDDAIAILTALAAPSLDVLGIVPVAGNVPLPLTLKNALQLVELAGMPETPVIAGCARPMLRPLVTAEHVHGKTGMDGPTLPEPSVQPVEGHGVDWMIDTIRNHPPKTITLAVLGPMTNLALALIKAPDITERIQQVVFMGGAYFEVGNITPSAEFNIYVDPHAAHVVFTSGIDLVMMPLDVTHKALIRPEWLKRLAAVGTPVCDAAAAMLDFYERFDVDKYGAGGGPLHDPCVTAYLLQPELFTGKQCSVRVETGSELTLGFTAVDWWQVEDHPHNALVIGDLDSEGFFELLLRLLKTL